MGKVKLATSGTFGTNGTMDPRRLWHVAFNVLIAAQNYWWANTFGFVGYLVGTLLRMGITVSILTLAEAYYPRISDHNSSRDFPLSHLLFDMVKYAMFDAALMYWAVESSVSFIDDTQNSDNDISFWKSYAEFVVKSLVWEIVFDVFFYWSHRLCHSNKFLFNWTHADHHLHVHTAPISTFAVSVPETVLTNLIPMLLAFYLPPGVQFTPWQLHLLFAFKTSVEISGHSGLDRGCDWSFPQFPPLAAITSICIQTNDHDLHHKHSTLNFSKRFKLWDVVFGTYQSPAELQQKRFERRLDQRLHILDLWEYLHFGTGLESKNPPHTRVSVANPVGIDNLRIKKNRLAVTVNGARPRNTRASVIF